MTVNPLKTPALGSADEPLVTLTGGSQATRPGLADADMGDSRSQAALDRLNQAVAELKALAITPLLRRAIAAIAADDAATAAQLAIEVLEQDERNALGWHVLAIAREQAGDFKSSISAYEAALALSPDHVDIANDLGRLAFRMGHKTLAAQLFLQYRAARPDCPHGANNLACALRDLHEYDAAIEALRRAIGTTVDDASLWNTLATVVAAQGDAPTAVIFFDEALRINPTFAKARYNRGNARMELGDMDGALSDCEAALTGSAPTSESAMMRLSRAMMLVNAGRVGEGWDAYEVRRDPLFAEVTHFNSSLPCWEPQCDLAGKSILLFGEQGLGDEVMFANYLPDLIEALGPDGRLTLGVEPRLVPLFQRSFPSARVGPHQTYQVDGHTLRGARFADTDATIDLWAPLASPLRRFRRSAAAFPDRGPYLKPDIERVEHWRRRLADLPGRKVGVLWKSLKLDGVRLRQFSPFEQWRPVLETAGISFVNLQYGGCDAELAQATAMGLNIWQPPGIDLKDDLDDVAALTSALDLIVAPANATSNIAAACGVPTWLIATSACWPQLGTDYYPWYPRTRVFKAEYTADRPAYWAGLMSKVAGALGDWAIDSEG